MLRPGEHAALVGAARAGGRLTEEGAAEQLDRLGERYTGRPYFSELVAAGLAKTEMPVLCKILPLRVVTLDAR